MIFWKPCFVVFFGSPKRVQKWVIADLSGCRKKGGFAAEPEKFRGRLAKEHCQILDLMSMGELQNVFEMEGMLLFLVVFLVFISVVAVPCFCCYDCCCAFSSRRHFCCQCFVHCCCWLSPCCLAEMLSIPRRNQEGNKKTTRWNTKPLKENTGAPRQKGQPRPGKRQCIDRPTQVCKHNASRKSINQQRRENTNEQRIVQDCKRNSPVSRKQRWRRQIKKKKTPWNAHKQNKKDTITQTHTHTNRACALMKMLSGRNKPAQVP